ncbi:hypothetical protein WKI68_20745 [Streptomyces sp. MS1.HAVA.3]|uniref:Uncharacterized protein n=1 Tax=Streptomyces caledonius TaxID=3134107 RepID=A0ABU8U5J0_9ACTN
MDLSAPEHAPVLDAEKMGRLQYPPLPIKVETDYLPEALLDFAWRGEFDAQRRKVVGITRAAPQST